MQSNKVRRKRLNSGPPREASRLAKRESRLAYSLLVPTIVVVFSVVLIPLLANFWISFKPIRLGDLRPATPTINERLLEDGSGQLTLRYIVRNVSAGESIRAVTFTDQLPDGLSFTSTQECSFEAGKLQCGLGDLRPRERREVLLNLEARPGFAADSVNVRSSEPIISGRGENKLTSFEFTLQNYQRMFLSSEFWSVLSVTFYYTIFGTVSAIILGLFAALLLNSSFPGRGVLRGLFLFPYVAPVIAVAYAWVLLLDAGPGGTLNAILEQVGAIDGPINFLGQRSATVSLLGLSFEFPVALTTVILFEGWRYFPLSFLFILARMQSIPSEIYEAAEMDGASPLQQFWHLSLPQLAAIMAVLFLLRFIWTFNKFDDIFLLTGGGAGTRTLTVDVFEQAFALSNLGAGAAVAVSVFVLLLASALVFFRFTAQEET